MKLIKIFKKTFAVAAAFTALFAMSCANDSSSSVTPGAIDISNAAPGSVITIDGEEVVVLENTYYQDPSRAVSNARSAVQVEGLSEQQNNLIRHYMEEMGGSKIKKMLQDVNINQYVQGWKKGDTKVNMPYLNGEVVYASDYFYYFNNKGKKIAHFKLNWESGKVVQALTGAGSEPKTLDAVKKFEEMTGLPITETLPSGRYDYTTIDVDKYARFRASNDPNVFKCQSFPENINPSKVSEKKEITYTYNYVTQGDGENKTVKVTDFDRENLKSWNQSLYYQMIDGKANSAYNEYPEFNKGDYSERQFQLRENGISGAVKFYAISRDNYTKGSNPNECKVKITASGKGDVKGNVSDAEYKNETQIRTNTNNDFLEFTKKVTGSSLTGENAEKAVKLRCIKSDNSDKSKPFAEMTVKFYADASSNTVTETTTLAEAISKYFSSDLILSEETTEINGWTVPAFIRFRATFLTEGRASHNKKYAWVKLVPEAKGEGFIYQMPINETVAGNDVPENVKIYCDNYRDIYVAGTYNEDYINTER